MVVVDTLTFMDQAQGPGAACATRLPQKDLIAGCHPHQRDWTGPQSSLHYPLLRHHLQATVHSGVWTRGTCRMARSMRKRRLSYPCPHLPRTSKHDLPLSFHPYARLKFLETTTGDRHISRNKSLMLTFILHRLFISEFIHAHSSLLIA